MGVLASDNFQRANQSGWGTASDSQVWANVFGPATTAIASNHGTIGNLNSYTVYRLGSTQTADIDAVVTLMVSGSALNGAGHAWRIADANNHYRIVTFDNTIFIEKIVSGSKTTITTFAFTITTSSHIKLRVQHIGSALKVKAWLEGASEPGTWDVTLTENSITSAGYFGLVSDLFGGAGVGVSEYWDYLVTDGSSLTTSTRTVTSTASILTELSRSVSSSASILTELTRSVSSTASILVTNERSVPSTAAILVENARSVSSSASILESLQRSVPSTAALLVESTRTVPESAALLVENSRSVPSDAAILVESSRVVPSSTSILTELARMVPATASILVQNTRIVPCTAAIDAEIIPSSIEPNALVYVRSGEAQTYARGGESTVYVREL